MSRLRPINPSTDGEEPDPMKEATWLFSYADLMTQLLLFVILTVTVVGLKDFKAPDYATSMALHENLDDAAERLTEYVKEHDLQDLMAIDQSADRVTIRLKSLLLFELGQAALTERAEQVLADIAALLAVVQRDIRVEGHTDDVPIHTRRFPSNWELSTARAISVVESLLTHDIDRTRLAVAGYGEFKPIVGNDSEEHRALNRRVEIVILGL